MIGLMIGFMMGLMNSQRLHKDSPKYQCDTLDDTLENSNDTLDSKIIVMLNENANLTQMELAEAFHVSVPTIKRAIKKLMDSGRILRKGRKRFGYWDVL